MADWLPLPLEVWYNAAHKKAINNRIEAPATCAKTKRNTVWQKMEQEREKEPSMEKEKKTDQNKMKSNIFGVVRVESEKKETLDWIVAEKWCNFFAKCAFLNLCIFLSSSYSFRVFYFLFDVYDIGAATATTTTAAAFSQRKKKRSESRENK